MWSIAVAAIALLLGDLPFPGDAQVQPIVVPVVLPVTGNAAFVGATESKGLLVLQDYVNKTGGINGRPIKFDIQDDQNSPAIDVQLFSRIAASKVPVVLGPSLSASVLAATPLLKDGPVTLCFAPGVYPEQGSYVFSPYASIYDLAVVSAHYAKKRGWKKIAFLFTTDATGADSDRVFSQVFGAPDSPAKIVADEHFTVTDLGVSAQVARIKASEPDVVVMFTTGSPAATALRTLQDSGVTVPILAAWSNAGVAQMTAFKNYLPKELLIPGPPTIVAPDQLPKGLLRDNLATYVHQFELAGVQPDVLNASSWDAGSLVINVLRTLGPNAGASEVRKYLAGLTTFVGISGTYNFKKIPQRGLDWKSGVLMTKWDPAKAAFVAVTDLGG